MTTHDTTDLEARLRASLTDRAGDVEVTPALYERVQRRATRTTWLVRGLAVAGAAAVAVTALVVVPALLPDPTPFDVVDTPEEARPSGAPTASEDSQPAVPVDGAPVHDEFVRRGLAYAETLADGTHRVVVGDRVVVADQPVVSLATDPLGAIVAVGFADGSIGSIDVLGEGMAFDDLAPAAANGGAVVPTPLGDGVAWIEGTDLHVLPLVDGAVVRVLPLEGDVPADLRIEQWFAGSDAQVVLASAPGGGLWSLPMDDSNVFNSAPTDPGFLLAADALDGALLNDLSRVELVPGPDQDALQLRRVVGTTSETSADGVATSSVLTTDGDRVVLLAPGGPGELVGAIGTGDDFRWDVPSITAVAPLRSIEAEESTGPGAEPTEGGDAAALGLRTDAPVIGTDGVEFVLRLADGRVQRREVYPVEESEAVLGRIAVRPGSTADDGLVAVESFSEGETTLRLVALTPGGTSQVGDLIITEGPVTGLVWSDDGTRFAWTDDAGLHETPVSDSGGLGGELLVAGTGPVVDWVWELDDGSTASGYLTTLVAGGTGTQLYGIDRNADGTVTTTGEAGGSDRVSLSTHATPGTIAGPAVTAVIGGGTAQLTWSADGDQSGSLADPGIVGGDVRVDASGGHVLVLGMDRQVLVTFDGTVVDLPLAADWDVVD